jgi:hypothetical protein
MNLFRQLEDRSYGFKRFATRNYAEPGNPLDHYHASFPESVYANASLVGRLQITHQLQKHEGCVNTGIVEFLVVFFWFASSI